MLKKTRRGLGARRWFGGNWQLVPPRNPLGEATLHSPPQTPLSLFATSCISPLILPLLLLFTLAPAGCFESVVSEGRVVYDKNELKIQRFSLFNQQEEAPSVRQSWKGDWLFRRERLQLVDKELWDAQADLLLLGGVMARYDNPLESDRSILMAGALKGYDWQEEAIGKFEESGESELIAVAVSPPLKAEKLRKLWQWKEGSLFFQELSSNGQPLYAFVFQSEAQLTLPRLESVVSTIFDFIKANAFCQRRVLIGGYFRTSYTKQLSETMEQFEFKDAAKGFCNVEYECYTESTRNELFMLVRGEAQPARSELIFVHRTAMVSQSLLNFSDSQSIGTSYYKSFGLQSLWPSMYFGWLSTVRLAMCE
ncbi:MAG: hypothetical protein HYW48_02920 [Deltaproteobacteria bacterium]|nr:hypothetical protein [Deltaproteobacteria bacterium]